LVEKTVPTPFAHIRRMKDFKKVKVEFSEGTSDDCPIICPLTKIEMNGLNRFVLLWKCGCIFSEKMLSTLKFQEKRCLVCNTPFKKEDIVSLNLGNEEKEKLRKELVGEKRVLCNIEITPENPARSC
jgi:hypothetical protein